MSEQNANKMVMETNIYMEVTKKCKSENTDEFENTFERESK